jgi:hypothetical protein
MIVKSSSLVIAGMIVAGEAFAKHRRDTLPRATATTDTTPISITSATALSSTTAKYFTSSWPDFPSNFDEHQNYTIDYLVGDDIDTAFYQTQPSIDLILLYTTADTVPDGSNTYEVMSIKCKIVLPKERSVLILDRYLRSCTRFGLFHSWSYWKFDNLCRSESKPGESHGDHLTEQLLPVLCNWSGREFAFFYLRILQ